MRPRYYVHMGPKAAEKVSCMWKAAHIFIYFLILCSSGVATVCIYNILDMYNFNCVIYSRAAFETAYIDRIIPEKTTEAVTENVTIGEPSPSIKSLIQNFQESSKEKRSSAKKSRKKRNSVFLKNFLRNLYIPSLRNLTNNNDSNIIIPQRNISQTLNNTGFVNMRKSVFATIYMCDLMLFAPLASNIMAIFLGALIAVGGKGGAGNPGDVLPNPWICVYPFLALCAFMMLLSFIADNLFHTGLASFCLTYYEFTKTKSCSRLMDNSTIQFTEHKLGPARPFYLTYVIGSYGIQCTSAFWVIQTCIYIFRILCLADFSLYLTRIRLKDDNKNYDAKMANIVIKLMDSKPKLV